jgi:hypothetical protein
MEVSAVPRFTLRERASRKRAPELVWTVLEKKKISFPFRESNPVSPKPIACLLYRLNHRSSSQCRMNEASEGF